MTKAEDERGGLIYLLRDPRDHAPRYVGKTIGNERDRLAGHVRRCKTGKSHCANWIRGLIDKGLLPEVEVLELVEPGSGTLNAAERNWIAKFKADGAELFNQTAGGDGGATMTGRTLSAEARAKVSAANKKEANPERARKISEAAKRRWQDPEYRALMSEVGKRGGAAAAAKKRGQPGLPHTEEARAKIRAARAKQVITAETGMKISAALKGTGKTHPPGWAEKVRETRARKRAEREGPLA